MADVVIRDLRKEDFPSLSKIIDDEWRFHMYSSKYGLDLATYYLLINAHGSSVARTLLVDGVPAGAMILKDKDRKVLDFSSELAEISEELEGTENFDLCMKDLRQLEDIYRDFSKKHMKDEWTELALLILSDGYKGLGLGRRLIEEATNCARQMGKTALFFYTDTECNVGFYEHIGAVRLGSEDMMCLGERLTVFSYYLEF